MFLTALLAAAVLTATPGSAASTDPRHARLCLTILPLADMARSSPDATLYRQVLGYYDRLWRGFAAADPKGAAAIDVALDLPTLKAGSRQTKNTQASECVIASGVRAEAQIVE